MTKIQVLVLCLLLLTAGCARYPGTSQHEVDFAGTIERTHGGFQMNGTVMVVGGTSTDQNFSSVSVTLYTADKVAYQSVDLCRFSTRPDWGATEKRINLTAAQQPKYILIESPSLWNTSSVAVKGFVWDSKEKHYVGYTAGDKSEGFKRK
jgi:hypothetical protein